GFKQDLLGHGVDGDHLVKCTAHDFARGLELVPFVNLDIRRYLGVFGLILPHSTRCRLHYNWLRGHEKTIECMIRSDMLVYGFSWDVDADFCRLVDPPVVVPA